jgi:hypothetical protein
MCHEPVLLFFMCYEPVLLFSMCHEHVLLFSMCHEPVFLFVYVMNYARFSQVMMKMKHLRMQNMNLR